MSIDEYQSDISDEESKRSEESGEKMEEEDSM